MTANETIEEHVAIMNEFVLGECMSDDEDDGDTPDVLLDTWENANKVLDSQQMKTVWNMMETETQFMLCMAQAITGRREHPTTTYNPSSDFDLSHLD
jgi:hypothetical protein